MAKVTKRDMFLTIADVLGETEGNEDMVAFLTHEVALIDKRANAPRKATKAQIENAGLKDGIVAVLSGTSGSTATEIAGALGVSVQKASQLLRQLIADGFVTKTEAHGKEKARFSVA